MQVLELNESNFKEFTSSGVVVVDFYANWCGPCKMMAPILEALSEEISTTDFVAIDTDDAEDVAIRYGISSIPCMILFKNGEEADRVVGAVPKAKLEEMLK